MVQVNLQPLAKTDAAFRAYLDLNLRRIVDAMGNLGRVEQFTATITGEVVVDTGIPIVKNAVATLASAPVAGACFLRTRLDPSNEANIIITVYANTFAVSAIPIDVNVIVVGDEPPNRPTRSS